MMKMAIHYFWVLLNRPDVCHSLVHMYHSHIKYKKIIIEVINISVPNIEPCGPPQLSYLTSDCAVKSNQLISQITWRRVSVHTIIINKLCLISVDKMTGTNI